MRERRNFVTTNNPEHFDKRGGIPFSGNSDEVIDQKRRTLLKGSAITGASTVMGSWIANPVSFADPPPQSGPQQQHGSMEYAQDLPGLNLLRLREGRLEKIRHYMKQYDFDALLLFNPLNQRYAIDATNQTVRNMRYERRCVIVPVSDMYPVTLLDWVDAPYLYTDVYGISPENIGVMDSYDYIACGSDMEMKNQAENFAQQVTNALPPDTYTIAADRMRHLGVQALESLGTYGTVKDGQPATQHARSIKIADEITIMKHVVQSCQQGLELMNQATDEIGPGGIRENELWAILQQHNIAQGGEWIETRLLTAGDRTNPWFQECSGNKFYAGDMVSFDTDLVGPYGYCADISRSWVAGKDFIPTKHQKDIYQYAVNQLTDNLSRVKAGASLQELAAASWNDKIVPPGGDTNYFANRYSCPYHGVGLCDEYPSIPWVGDDWDVYGYDGELKENMVISVESYIGADLSADPNNGPEGCKVEQMVIVKDPSTSHNGKGYEILSDYPWDEKLYPNAPPIE